MDFALLHNQCPNFHDKPWFQIQIQKCSLDRNVTSAIYKLVFNNVLHTYKTKNKVLKVHEAENLPLVVQDEECVDKMGVLSDQH